MAAAKEIRTKIGSIKNTQKITSAMEMVAASKMRKAQDRMKASQPYAQQIRKVVGPRRRRQPRVQASVDAGSRGQAGRLHRGVE